MSNYGANNNNSLIKVIPMTPEKSRTLGTPRNTMGGGKIVCHEKKKK